MAVSSVRILLSVTFGVLVGLGFRITELSLAASKHFGAYHLQHAPDARIAAEVGYLFEGFSLGLLPLGSMHDSLVAAMLDGARTLQGAADHYALMFLGGAVAFLVLGYIGSLWPADSRRFARCMGLLALACMVVGQFAPIMSMTAKASVPLAGDSVVKQESKSVLTAVSTLHADGKTWVALLIVLFSFVVPTTKLLVTLVAGRSRSGRVRDAALRIVTAIGKWSMADVFVVALLLTIFSLRSDGEQGTRTESEPEIGLWFFLAHCVLALVASQLLARKRPQTLVPEAGPSSYLEMLLYSVVFVGVAVGSLLLLKPATRVEREVTIPAGSRWTCSVLAHDVGEVLRGNWHSSGMQLGGADDSMVAVHLFGPGGTSLQFHDHEVKGGIDIPITEPGVYTLVFDNVGIVRSSPRSVRVAMGVQSNSPRVW